MNRYEIFFSSSDNQFSFKRGLGLGCSHAIYTVKPVVSVYTSCGSTVNLCALDVKKAFDRVNHCGLFLKLMDRSISRTLLTNMTIP